VLQGGKQMMRDLIYDVGLENGDDTAYYLHCGYRVVAIEANLAFVQQASRRFRREIETGRLQIVNVGIFDREGTLPFYISDRNPQWSTFDEATIREKTSDFRTVDVPCRRFRSILERYGVPYYLKLDIEGAEIHCLRELSAVDPPHLISFEKTQRWSRVSLELLNGLGYHGFKLISQQTFLPIQYPAADEQRHIEKWQFLLRSGRLPIRIARKALGKQLVAFANPLRRRGGWVFASGSSGPFGHETAGRWQSYDEMLETLDRANCEFQAGAESIHWSRNGFSFWADFHAVRDCEAPALEHEVQEASCRPHQ
jgi:FkbM family methyltransferase